MPPATAPMDVPADLAAGGEGGRTATGLGLLTAGTDMVPGRPATITTTFTSVRLMLTPAKQTKLVKLHDMTGPSDGDTRLYGAINRCVITLTHVQISTNMLSLTCLNEPHHAQTNIHYVGLNMLKIISQTIYIPGRLHMYVYLAGYALDTVASLLVDDNEAADTTHQLVEAAARQHHC